MNENYRRPRQPQVVRARLLAEANLIVVERGLAGLSLDLVARRAGVSKGGLIHHFPSRQALVDALFLSLLAVFEKNIEDRIAGDENPRGRFTRAYVRATAAPCGGPDGSKLLGAFAVAMSHDAPLAAKWRDWVQRQLARHGEESHALAGRMIRYAADGIWLEVCTWGDAVGTEERDAVVEHLIELTYTL